MIDIEFKFAEKTLNILKKKSWKNVSVDEILKNISVQNWNRKFL